MKFRTLFFLFNLILLVSFAFIFLMPLPILGWEYAMSFWKQNWPIGLLFLAVLAALDSYFVVNWTLFHRLEREDWAGLRELLETEWTRKGKLGVQKTKILINACLIGQNPQRINELRDQLTAKKSPVVPKLALSLGLPLVLKGDSAGIEAFFGPLADDRRVGADAPWIRWCRAFGFLLASRPDEARPLLEAGLGLTKQPVLQLLSLYLLDNLKASSPELADRLNRDRQTLARRWTAKEWNAHLDALKERVILVLFMEKLIGEARTWLAEEGVSA